MKLINNTNPDAIAHVLDDVLALLAAAIPSMAPQAQTAIAAVEVGDTVANALLPVFQALNAPPPSPPAPGVVPAQQAAPAQAQPAASIAARLAAV